MAFKFSLNYYWTENVYATLSLREILLLNSLGDGFMHCCDILHMGIAFIDQFENWRTNEQREEKRS